MNLVVMPKNELVVFEFTVVSSMCGLGLEQERMKISGEVLTVPLTEWEGFLLRLRGEAQG